MLAAAVPYLKMLICHLARRQNVDIQGLKRFLYLRWFPCRHVRVPPPAGYSIFLLSELHTKNILKTYSGGTTEMFQGVKYIHIWRLAGKTQNDTEGACKIEICALLSLLCRHRRPPDSGRCFSADRSMLIKIGCDSDCGLMEAKREKERGNFRDDDWKNEKWLLFPGVMESYCMRARKANTSTSSSPFSNR